MLARPHDHPRRRRRILASSRAAAAGLVALIAVAPTVSARPRASTAAEIDAAVAAMRADPQGVMLVTSRPWRAYHAEWGEDWTTLYTAHANRRDEAELFDGDRFAGKAIARLSRALRGRRVVRCVRTAAASDQARTTRLTTLGLSVTQVEGDLHENESDRIEVRDDRGRLRGSLRLPAVDYSTEPKLTSVAVCPELPGELVIVIGGVAEWFDGESEGEDAFFRSMRLVLR